MKHVMNHADTPEAEAVITGDGGRVLLLPAGPCGLVLPAGRDREGRRPVWAGPGELQVLAQRTAWYAHGRMPEPEFTSDPGLAPQALLTLNALGFVSVHEDDLPAVTDLAATGKPRTPQPQAGRNLAAGNSGPGKGGF